MTHTQEPWKCDHAHHLAQHKESGPANRVYAVVECKCKPKHNFAVRYIPYNNDDAILITAAPKMLAALEVVLDQVDYMAGNCRVNEMVGAALPKEIIVMARQALAAVKG